MAATQIKFKQLADFNISSPTEGQIVKFDNNGKLINIDADDSATNFGYEINIITLITGSSATYTPSDNCEYFEVWVTGQGGGGGGADNGDASATSAAGGGGAGGTAYRKYTASEMGSSAVYTVGTSGGSGGANTGGNGSAGSNSTFNPDGSGSTITGNGGGGGVGMLNSTPAITITKGGDSGGQSNGEVGYNGGNGQQGFTNNGSMALSGAGGNSYFGGGGVAKYQSGAGAQIGSNGIAYGSGGGGAVSVNTTAGAVGGNGAGGAIVIKEYIKIQEQNIEGDIYYNGTASGVIDVDWDLYSSYYLITSANITLTDTNRPALLKTKTIDFVIVVNSSHIITLPVDWIPLMDNFEYDDGQAIHLVATITGDTSASNVIYSIRHLF